MRYRIFVVGVPRAGTTLVQSLLAAHSCLTSFPESHFFSRHYKFMPQRATPLLRWNPTQRLRSFLREAGLQESIAEQYAKSVDRRLWPGPLRILSSRAVATKMLDILDAIAANREVLGWVEKTPMHLHYIEFLKSLVPGPQAVDFVHVIRNGMDTVSSLAAASRSWETTYDINTCVDRWNHDVAISLGYLGQPRHHFVVYEELVNNPEKATRELFESLGLEWQPAVLQRYAEESKVLINDDETWKHNNSSEIQQPASRREELTPVQQRQIAVRLNMDLYTAVCRELDYIPTSANEQSAD